LIITERVAFIAGQAEAQRERKEAVDQVESAREQGLLDMTVQVLLNYFSHTTSTAPSTPMAREAQILGAITGYISSAASDLSVSTYEEAIQVGADLLISDHQHTVAVEVTMSSQSDPQKVDSSVRYLINIVQKSPQIDSGILVVWSHERLMHTELEISHPGKRITVLAPERLCIRPDLLAPTRITQISEQTSVV
jgi:hypothetical protein